ncbi:MAG TPA: dihydrolipoamide acetyltransferase family protein [Actinomycetota bacterium]|nr:dihydrolipoamide acetyltransferase family protein [Actinomycetota bacterium]
MPVREFLLPDLGEGLEDAEVVTWRVAEGDTVELNQILVEVNTAKALVEVPAPWGGVVEKLHAGEGETVKVGTPLVSIRVEEPTGAPAEPQPAVQEGAEPKAKRRAVLVGYGVEEEEPAGTPRARVEAPAPARERRGGPVPASPPVRRLAKEMGIDLTALNGSGPGGRVTREDVMKAASAPAAAGGDVVTLPGAAGGGATAPEELERMPVKGTRRLIAEKMARSAREIPHVTTFLSIDATHVQAFRTELSKETGEKISPLPIVVRALVDVCKQYPKLNSTFDADRSEIVLHGRRHIGIATDTENGLLAPVLRDADGKGIAAIAREIARLTEAARAGRAKPNELVGSTITVTNVGTFGAEYGTPIINHPEAAILALGVVEPRALVVDGRVEARPAVTLSLSFDHRVLDGAEAGRALRALGDVLESPFRLGALPR